MLRCAAMHSHLMIACVALSGLTLLAGCGAPTSPAPASAAAAESDSDSQPDGPTRPEACGDRECGPAPGTAPRGSGGTYESCGTCDTEGALACNDGRCEARCDPTACAAMSSSVNTCERVTDDPCDVTVRGGQFRHTFECSADGLTCEESASATGCGTGRVTCAPCDLEGSGDGLCSGGTCRPAGEVECPDPA